MKTQTVIIALTVALFAALAFADHNRTSLFFGLGQKEGHWTEISENGDVFDGHYVDGERRGPWTARFANKVIGECIYAKDMHYCDWIMHDADGNVLKDDMPWLRKQLFWRSATNNSAFETPFVNGKKHGRWVERFANGDVFEGPYVDDKRHGDWVLRGADGTVREGPFVDGKRHGDWVLRWANRAVREGPFVNGKKHGDWVERYTTGAVHEGPFANGEKHGTWVLRLANGNVYETCWENGKSIDC